jgi:hypothetical protein
MTIRMLQAWNGLHQQKIVTTLSGSDEAALVAAGIATYDLDGPAENLRMAQLVTDAGGNVIGLVDPKGGIVDFYPTSNATPLFRWVAGDAGSVISVATSTPVTTDAVDVSLVKDGSLFIVNSGGTLSVTYAVSEDGISWSATAPLTSGLGAATYASLLSAIKLESGFFRLTFSASGATCSVKSFFCATSATSSLDTRQIKRAVFGDGAANVAMSASSAITSPPIDLTACVRDKSVLRVIVASGTVKVSASVSRDGINEMYSLGDLQTGMTAGSYAINLSSLAQYGHFVTVTVTETAAAAASVNGFALLSVADEHSSSGNIRRAAVIGPMMAYSGAEWATNYAAPTMASYAMLKRMGYDAEILPLYDSSPILDSGDKTHDLFVWPATAHAGLWSTWTSGSGKPIGRLVKGGTAIPLICLGVTSNNNATLLANIGAGDRDTETYRKIVFSSDSASWYVPNAGTYQVTQQAHMSDFRTIATDSALAGKIAWSYRGSAGRVYVAAGFNGANDCNMLPLILGEAVSDGVIDAPPRKVKVVLDIDDMPACEGGAVGIMTLSDLSSVYTELQAMQMPCTFGIRVEDITAGRQQSAISAFVSQRSVLAGGLIYPIVHNGNWFWKDGTKAVKHAAYTSDISVARGSGISVGSDANQLNAYGYTYFNNNAFDEETTQLGQPGSSASASTDNRTRSAGYGWRVIRADGIGGLNTETIGEPSSVFGVTLHRGIRIVASHVHISASDKSVDFDDGSTGTAKAALQCARFFHYSLCYGMPFYFHGQNCFDGHDGGNAPGTLWLRLLSGMWTKRLSNVMQFVHGSALRDEPL